MTDEEILEMADNHIKMQFESVRDRELACLRFARALLNSTHPTHETQPSKT